MTNRKIPDSIQEAAYLWVAKMTSGDVDQTQQQQLQNWLAENPAHQQAYNVAINLWQQLGQLKLSPSIPSIQTSRRRRRYSRRLIASAASIAGLLLLAQPSVIKTLQADYTTASGESKMVQLSDGSTVYLNTASAIAVDYSAERRGIHLLAGEAEFVVQKNPERPFVVTAGNETIKALGTAFMVKNHQQDVIVTMLENRVEISVPQLTQPIVLNPGEQVSYQNQQSLGAVHKVDTQKATAWRRGKLVFESTPLKTVIEEINRYHPGVVRLVGTEHAQLPVSGVFDLQQLDRLLGVIEHTLAVKSTRIGEQLVLIY